MQSRKKELEQQVSSLASLCRILLFRPLTSAEAESALKQLGTVPPEALVDSLHLMIEEGISPDDLKPAVSKLINLVLDRISWTDDYGEDPFLASLHLENQLFLEKLDYLRPVAKELLKPLPYDLARMREALDALRLGIEELKPILIHYVKKENLLFPYFEARYPRYKCISVMWSLHDDMRDNLAILASMGGRRSERPDHAALATALGRLFFDGSAIAQREERILFPIVSSLLEAQEKLALFEESKALGFCFLDSEQLEELQSLGKTVSLSESAAGSPETMAGGEGIFSFSTGALSMEALEAIFKLLPCDVSLIDAEDRFTFFSDGEKRVFPRSKASLGRDVRNCHPPSSVDKVLSIIEAFRRGQRDSESFWLQIEGRFIFIVYKALRDKDGKYLGTVEFSQDVTEIRGLSGEKRLASF